MKLLIQLLFALDTETGFGDEIDACYGNLYTAFFTKAISSLCHFFKGQLDIMKFSLKILDLRLNGVMPYLLSNIGINCRVIDGMIGIRERIIFFKLLDLMKNFFFILFETLLVTFY